MALMGLAACAIFANGTIETGTTSKQYVMKLASPSNPQDNCVKAFYHFEKEVEKQSNGQIDVQVFDSGQLGDHKDYIASLQMNSIQGAEINTSMLESVDSAFMLFDLPYIIPSMDDLRTMLDSGLNDTLNEKLTNKAQLTVGGWLIRCPRDVYSSKGPIHNAEDFKGLKIRVMDSPIMVRTMELLKATPVPISASERYMALQTKVVDAAENSPAIVLSEKEYEVTTTLSLTEHSLTPNCFVISNIFLQSLPENLRVIVLDEAKAAGIYEQQLEKEGLTALAEKGMIINKDVDKDSFRAMLTPLYDEYADQIGQDILAYCK